MAGTFVMIPVALLNEVADPASDLDGLAIAVWVALRSYADFGSEEGAFVTDRVAAPRSGCSVPTFKRHRQALRKAGWIDWESGKEAGRSNRYTIRDRPLRVGHSERPVGQTDLPLAHTDPPGSVTVSDIPRVSLPRANAYPPRFVDFWTAYPRKRSKKRAYTLWVKLSPNPELLRQATENFIGEMNAEKRRRDKIMYAEKWLREWEEWVEVEQPNGSETNQRHSPYGGRLQ